MRTGTRIKKHSFAVASERSIIVGANSIGLAAEILVAAAASLSDVLKEISSDYQAQSKHKVKFNFGPSSGLARQIDEGAPVDIFFSADLLQMDNLEKKGREPKTRKNLFSNQLVIIVSGDSKLALSLPRLSRPRSGRSKPSLKRSCFCRCSCRRYRQG